jgi:short-subunit dehydrogenase
MAHCLGIAGARIILLARREAELKSAALQLEQDSIDVNFINWDLNSALQAKQAASEIQNRFGDVDILINAAGTNLRKKFIEIGVLRQILKFGFVHIHAIHGHYAFDEGIFPGRILAMSQFGHQRRKCIGPSRRLDSY